MADDTCQYCDQRAVVKIQDRPCCRKHIDTAMAEVGKIIRHIRHLVEDSL